MDMASDYESGDSGFESRRGSFLYFEISSQMFTHSVVIITVASVAQLVARKSHNLKVPGSIPGGGILHLCMDIIERYEHKENIQRAFVAQTVERQPFKLLAVGSIPTEGVLL